ncbi:GNAT family N-acetyltransferase [Saprospiraceae bacterium]|nr:GNAT family N-acetyltransferase [Saprospiraceae bacterium]
MKKSEYISPSKVLYSNLCEEKYIPIHGQSWWLDVVCGADNWDVVLAFDRYKNIIGALPYTKNRRLGLSMIRMPILTSYLPIFLDYPDSEKKHQRYSFERKILTELTRQLPKVSIFDQNYSSALTNWLPFYWSGFKQSTRYTYILEDLKDVSFVYKELESSVRGKIRKAEQALIEVVTDENVVGFYEVVQKTFQNQGQIPPFSLNVLKQLDNVLKTRDRRKIYFAKDKNGDIHAGGYVVWDERRAYYLASGTDSKFRKSGAHYLLLWTAIKDCSKTVESFDFEGSMLPQVENVFRSFGAIQVPYFRIYKTGNRILSSILTFMGKL